MRHNVPHEMLLRPSRSVTRTVSRSFSSKPALRDKSPPPPPRSPIDVDALLAKPCWSAASLLPSSNAATSPNTPPVTRTQLHHLLRLSALPAPRNAAEEKNMLDTLSSQLHFVRSIQEVDTTGIAPLASLRDETAQGMKSAELGLDQLKEALAQEESRGEVHHRIRRKRERVVGEERRVQGKGEDEVWDVLGLAQRKVGRYFVVEGGKD